MIEILNIIDKIYESKYFTTVLISAVIVLVVLFVAVLILGIRDANRLKNPKRKDEDDIKDITFDVPSDALEVKEDVTFEMPALTKNLEDFKKSLEEEIQREDEASILSESSNPKEVRPVKITDVKEIENTAVMDKIDDK